MKQLFSIVIIVLFAATGCSSDKSTDLVSATTEEQKELNIEQRITPKILPPSPSGPTVTLAGSLDTLFSALGVVQTVTFAGTVADFTSAWYTLADEYGEVADSGSITTAIFAIPELLNVVANANDADGRMYIFTVTAEGTLTVSMSDTVVVPYIPANNDDDDDDEDDEDNDSCGNGHHGKNHHKHHWKCEKCGKHNNSSYGNHWKCKKCDWSHDKEWKCKKCGKHHDRDGKKDNCKKKRKGGRDGRGG